MEMDKDKRIHFITAFILILMIPMIIINGLVLMTIWGWFIVPLFSGLVRNITLPEAIGLGIVIGYLTHQFSWAKREDDEIILPKLLTHIITGPIFILIVSIIVKQFL